MANDSEHVENGIIHYKTESSELITIDLALANELFVTSRCANFKQAARSLNVAVVGLRKRLENLEVRLGAPVFVYKQNKLVLTRAGQRLCDHIVSAFRHDRLKGSSERQTSQFRIAVAEPVLSDIVCRELITFIREHAETRLEILSDDVIHQISEGAVDIAVFLSETGGPAMNEPDRYVIEKLGTVGYSLFISSRYARASLLPEDEADLGNYMLVLPPKSIAPAQISALNSLTKNHQGGSTKVESYALARALVVGGACVGVLPDYSRNIEKNIMALPGFLQEVEDSSIYIAIKLELIHAPEIAKIANLIRKSFVDKQDWFRH